MKKSDDAPVFVMVKRKLVITWVISYIALIGVILGVAVWSNQQWCGVITIFNDTYKDNPPTTVAGHKLASEFRKIQNHFLCK